MSAPDELIAGRYRLVKLVGTGGMGSVWEAMDERLQRPVAVKQLHAQLGLSPEETELANQRAMREARITARLHHRHAVPVFDVVEHQGRPCLIMQFLPSMALSAVLRQGGPLQNDEAAQVGAQISSALAAAHAVGIVHRDVKPGNILIADDGAALITDFGISHAMGDTTLTATGLVHGTPAFLAPEVARGQRVDVRLRRLLTGIHAVRGPGGNSTLRIGLERDHAAPSGGIRGVPATAARRAAHPGRCCRCCRRPRGTTVHEGRGRHPSWPGRSRGRRRTRSCR